MSQRFFNTSNYLKNLQKHKFPGPKDFRSPQVTKSFSDTDVVAYKESLALNNVLFYEKHVQSLSLKPSGSNPSNNVKKEILDELPEEEIKLRRCPTSTYKK